ncbi:CGNR zinc finger domain-containing protein [Streptomyces sp. NPDC059957]|uniref:CGNR zinc finger domain-containing protein n=1 Tax=unclassified Streptomyces TaxID=2593676 RepID=UPI00365C6C24
MLSHIQTQPPVGIAPLNGAPLPLEFANTVFPLRGTMCDSFDTPAKLAWWLRSCRGQLTTHLPDGVLEQVDAADVHLFTLLRDATRRLVGAFVDHHEPDPLDVAHINRAAGLGRPWPLLQWNTGERPVALSICPATPVLAVQAEIAHAVVDLLTGACGAEPKACQAPGCVFFFDHMRSRQQWCSTGCGNRARAARHYARHRRPVD